MPDYSETNYPERFQPMVGYVFWRLQRGEDLDTAMARAERKTAFGPLTEEEWVNIRDIASGLFEATRSANSFGQATPESSIAATTGLPGDAVVGLRVRVAATLASGEITEVSVMVNAGTYIAYQDALQAAEEWVLANAASVWGSRYRVDAASAVDIAQISGIPWDNAFTVF